MTDEQINRAIAGACGWTEIQDSGVWHHHKLWGYPPLKPSQGGNSFHYLPNYCNDLNAMHEAEKVLTEINWFTYISELAQIVRLPKQPEVQIKQSIHATARQRLEAFLRTLGKWEEVQK